MYFQRACPHPTCSDHGVCVNGQCYCTDGWRGKECAEQIMEPTIATVPATVVAALVPMVEVMPSPSEKPRQISRELDRQKLPKPSKIILPLPNCSNHGKFVADACRCDRGWEGRDCEREVCPPCEHGVCKSGLCICEVGWTGNLCDHADCAIGCQEHGKCMKNGTCLCDKGWNGENCHIEGCPLSCSGHGECRWGSLQDDDGEGWRCDCQPSFTGGDCAVPVETDCQDGLDNDNDGLIDCDDPECCSSSECSREPVCAAVPTPVDVLLRLPAVQNANFFQRVSFIIRNDSVQSYSDHSQFNESMISVIRGRVVWNGGAVSDSKSTVPLPGVRVSDAANPLYGFTLTRLDGEFDLLVNGGRTVNLQFLRSPFQRIKRSVYVPPNEIVVVDPVKMAREEQRELSARPECSIANRVLPIPVLRPEWTVSTDGIPSSTSAATLVVDTRSVVQSLPLPGSSVRLVYDSSRATSSQSTLVLGLLPNKPDPDVRLVHVIVKIAGKERFEKSLAPRENLTYVWSWDKLNVYRQSDHGMIPADVKIGYEYRGCGRPSELAWISRRVFMEGARARRLEGGAWSVDIHHHLDAVNGGWGVLEMGNGGRRFIANSAPVLELLVGTNKRRQLECQNCNGPVTEANLFRPSTLAHGLDGSVFIGDHNLVRRIGPEGQITTVLSLSLPDTSYPYYLAVSPLDGFLVVLAGDGTACPAAADSCGDGGPATDAQLFFPKGLAYDAQGNLYARVAYVLVGTSANGQIFVLDSNVVYQLDRAQDTAEIVVGALTTCQNASSRHILRNARDIAVATDGSLYVIESDGKKLNQIRRLSADRTSFPVIAGQKTACACDVAACGCDDAASPMSVISVKMALFSAPSAVSVDAVGRVYVADAANAKVKRITPRVARYDPMARQYSVVDADRNELYTFNRYGLHTSTQSLITGAVLYNFTYNVDT
ncbi:EGF-like domain protein, partial [Ostertagia ostertagi]